jgi:hypothetical protein
MKERRQAVFTWIYLVALSHVLIGLIFAITFVTDYLGFEPIWSRPVFRFAVAPETYETGGAPWILALAIFALLGGLIWLGRWAMRNAADD